MKHRSVVGVAPDAGSLTPFLGLVHDFILCDRSQSVLFDAVGQNRGLFSGVHDWPDLRDVLSARSAAILSECGEDAWVRAGGASDPEGRLTFTGDGSAAAAAAVREVARKPGGFLWTDELGIAWAVRLVAAGGADPNVYHGFAFSWLLAGWTLNATSGGRRQHVAEGQAPDYADEGAARARRDLDAAVRRLWLFTRAEQCLWAIQAAVLKQRSSLVLLADVMLGQIVWGANRAGWPKHWRAQLFTVLRSLSALCWSTLRLDANDWRPRVGSHAVAISYIEDLKESRPADNICCPACPLYGAGAGHGHYLVGIGYGFLGALEWFSTADDGRGQRQYDFNRDPEEKKAGITEARKAGRIISVHLPSKLMGSPAGMSAGQRRILQALVREVGRSPAARRGGRPDRAMLVVGGGVPGIGKESCMTCPFLNKEMRYVSFNGNGKRQGAGYRLVGAIGTAWLAKAGYVIPDESEGRRRVAREFLEDLRDLMQRFDVTAAGFNPGAQNWLSIDDLISIASVAGGWLELDRLHLRVYGPEDYLDRWRRHFAGKLGFADVPGSWRMSEQEQTPAVASTSIMENAVVSPLFRLKLDMRKWNVKQNELATALGVSAAFVSKLLKGKRFPKGMFEKAQAFVAARAGDG